MDLEDRAAALYALPLDAFVGARNAAAKEATAAGETELARALKALPKPSSAAWLVNMLVTRRRDEVEQVLELGASLREAQDGLDRAQLHALGQQRQRLLAAVAGQSLEAAAEAGHDVGRAALPGVEQTLRAALADPSAAGAVLTGRLVRTLEATGWDAVDLAGAVGGPHPPEADRPAASEPVGDGARPAGDTRRDGARSAGDTRRAGTRTAEEAAEVERLRDAEKRVDAARTRREDAEEAGRQQHRAAERLRVRRDGLTASIEDLEERLEGLRRELAEVESASVNGQREATAAEETLERARKEEQAAQAVLDGLEH
ncbi:hypothetical protein FJV46_01870 [Arthrobacter agilis]|uniref:hypothetical protein n=1 Tax=Arthrobacter agilis TaxID=37921 RepID=UPI000B35D432|nr:hypothetical protein [Arthrobacter agilis]OUM40624.1 hypothetical protein B8W74_14105 [Arthrobacter agilis]PPB45236.1 hypothetical protein CI784_14135 [Arthrobacter agilis]TPV27939.1 hypothetical protein FJV46_01870 [Arthrobacter agilis]VDR31378.1 Uncharacterised protein [Arthrobacter agilis]